MWHLYPFASSDYVFVTPVEVDSEGAYLSHDVSRRSHRSRRSLSPSLHYRFSAFGQNMHLDLHPSSVVGPGFTVQSVGSGGISTIMGDAEFHNCLYQGFIRNLTASSAAISTCSGLVSISCQWLLAEVFHVLPKLISLAIALSGLHGLRTFTIPWANETLPNHLALLQKPHRNTAFQFLKSCVVNVWVSILYSTHTSSTTTKSPLSSTDLTILMYDCLHCSGLGNITCKR